MTSFYYNIPGSVYFLLYLFLRNPDLLQDELQHLSKIQKCQVILLLAVIIILQVSSASKREG